MPTAYQRRLELRREGQKRRNAREQEELGVYVDQVLQAYEDAYAAFNEGNRIRLHYKSGWVRIGSTNLRLFEVVERTKLLQARFHERELNTPEEAL